MPHKERGNAMRRYNVTRGAKTTAGGTVTTGSGTVILMGEPLAREGDSVECPACGTVGVIVCAGRHLEALVSGSESALEGDICQCACSPSPTLIANQSIMFQTFEGPLAPPVPLEEEEEEEALDEGITLRIGLFFDGTGNNDANAGATAGCHVVNFGYDKAMADDMLRFCRQQGFDGAGGTPNNSYGNTPSNVARLYGLYRDDADTNIGHEREAGIAVYLEGIGTTSGEADSLLGQGMGIGSTGVAARVEQAPAVVVSKLRQFRIKNPKRVIQRIEFDLFGFSRGGAAARHCANEILKGPHSLFAQAIPPLSDGLANDFDWRHGQDFIINFIGLFDTVPGIADPLAGDFSPHNAHNPGLNLRLAPGSARKVVQLVAEHEYRHNFSLMLSGSDIRLPGAHSDIGGGYLPLATERVVLSQADLSLEALDCPATQSKAYQRARERGLQGVAPYGHAFGGKVGIHHWEEPLPYDRRFDVKPLKHVYAAVTSERQVRGELSLVYLRIMRELGTRARVPFGLIDDRDPKLALPDELKPIAQKLRAYALGEAPYSLSEAELRLLRHHYIHLSANWTVVAGKGRSGIEALFINRPGSGNRRAEHPNE